MKIPFWKNLLISSVIASTPSPLWGISGKQSFFGSFSESILTPMLPISKITLSEVISFQEFNFPFTAAPAAEVPVSLCKDPAQGLGVYLNTYGC